MADNKLYALMHERGITLKALGDQSGVAWKTIRDYTQGRHKTYTAQAYIILRLADALGVHPRDIVDDPPSD